MTYTRLALSLILVSSIVRLMNGQVGPNEARDIRKELASIALHEAKDLQDYVQRAQKIKPLLPELADFYEKGNLHIEQLKKKYQSRPDLLNLANFIQRLNERDKFGFELLKEEIRLATELTKKTAGERQAYFDSKIAPLQQVEENVVEEEITMANKAIDDGIPLPKDIVDGLKARRANNAQGH